MGDGHYPTLVSKDRHVNAVGNPLWLEITDGTAAIHKAVDGASGGSDSGLVPLVVRDDTLSALTPVDGDYVQLRVNANGALWVEDVNGAGSGPSKDDDSAFSIGVDKVSPGGFLADETAPDSVDEGDVGIARMTLDRKQLMVIVDATTDANRLAIDANGYITVKQAATVNVDIQDSWAALTGGGTEAGVLRVTIASDSTGVITVDASDLDIRNLTLADDAVKISKDANANSQTNPIYVQVVSGVISGNEIHSFDTTVDVASDTGDNHDYTVAGTTFMLKSVIFAASGGIKVEVLTGPLASLLPLATAFIAKEGGFGQLVFDPPKEVPATSTGTVRVIRTNRQGQAQDVYSTIIGNDVA